MVQEHDNNVFFSADCPPESLPCPSTLSVTRQHPLSLTIPPHNYSLIASDKGLLSVLVLFDLNDAFDMIDHRQRQLLVGIKGAQLSWFES